MTYRGSEIERAVRSELEAYPVSYEFGHGGRHPFIRIVAPNGRAVKVTYSGTPRKFKFERIRADLRRALSRIGIISIQENRRA